MTDAAFAADVDALAARALRDAAGRRVVVLIDGRSGSGKSTLGRALAARLGAQLVRLDDLYPGWGGLRAGARIVADQVLRPTEPGWHRWDWSADVEAEWHPIDPAQPLVVEGCGALSRASAPHATLRVWVELDAATRRQRALARDGVVYERYWGLWAAQEDAYLAEEDPRALADVEIDRRG